MIPLLRAASIVLQSRRQKSTNLVLLNLSKAASNSLNMLKLSPTLKPTLSASSFSYRVYGSGEWETLHITCSRDCASDKIYSRCRCSKENTSDPYAGAVATAFQKSFQSCSSFFFCLHGQPKLFARDHLLQS